MPRPPRIPHPREFSTQAEAIDGGAYFLLPLEVAALETRISKLDTRQKELGILLGEAMNESAETYHDNAPAEVVNNDSTIMIAEYTTVARALRNAERLYYPQVSDEVSIGNLVTIAYTDSDHEDILLTGYTRNVDTSLVVPSDFDQVVSAPSPLGRALLEARVGEEVAYRVGPREFKVGVAAIACVNQA